MEGDKGRSVERKETSGKNGDLHLRDIMVSVQVASLSLVLRLVSMRFRATPCKRF
jgi:hypothetical protein